MSNEHQISNSRGIRLVIHAYYCGESGSHQCNMLTELLDKLEGATRREYAKIQRNSQYGKAEENGKS